MLYWATHIMNGLSFGLLLFILAAGLSLVFGLCRIVNLAHGAFYLLGGYVGFSTVRFTENFPLAIAAGMISMACLGIITERYLLRRFWDRPLAQVLLTFGLIFVFQDLALWIWGGTPVLLKKIPILTGATQIGSFYYPTYRLFIMIIGLAIFGGLWWLFARTRLGIFIRASVDDREMAGGVGIRINFLMTMTFAFGALLTGLAGTIGAPFLGIYPGLDLEVLLFAMAVVILGGLGSLKGTFLGAIMVGLIDSIAKAIWPETGMFTMFALMAIVLILKPTGIFGLPIVQAGGHSTASEDLFLESLPAGSNPTDVSGLRTGWLTRPAFLWILIAVLLAASLLSPKFLPTYYLRLLTLALIWGIFAMSLDLILGFGGIVSLGHAVFFGISAYTIGILSLHLTSSVLLQIGAALLITVLTGLFLGWLLLRSSGVYFMMLTIAFSQVFWAIAHSWRSLTGGGDGLAGISRPEWMLSLENFYYLTWCVFLIVFILLRFLVKSRFGISLIGVCENEKRMISLGYDVTRIKLLSFTISGSLGGVAGILYVLFNGFVSPDFFSVDTSAQAIIMIILGGAGTLVGPIIGSFFVVTMQNILSSVTDRWTLILGLLFVVVVICAPTGVVGLWRKKWRLYKLGKSS